MTSIHDTLENLRKPRIHLKYEVETESGVIEKELPFVVGVMGDFAGNHPGVPLKPLNERKFINIDRDNFNAVMQKISPGLALRVDNTLDKNSPSELSVQLNFQSMEDFEPANIVQQVEALRQLKLARDQLRDLLTKVDRSEPLENILEQTLQNSQLLTQLAKEIETDSKEECL